MTRLVAYGQNVHIVSPPMEETRRETGLIIVHGPNSEFGAETGIVIDDFDGGPGYNPIPAGAVVKYVPDQVVRVGDDLFISPNSIVAVQED